MFKRISILFLLVFFSCSSPVLAAKHPAHSGNASKTVALAPHRLMTFFLGDMPSTAHFASYIYIDYKPAREILTNPIAGWAMTNNVVVETLASASTGPLRVRAISLSGYHYVTVEMHWSEAASDLSAQLYHRSSRLN